MTITRVGAEGKQQGHEIFLKIFFWGIKLLEFIYWGMKLAGSLGTKGPYKVSSKKHRQRVNILEYFKDLDFFKTRYNLKEKL